MFLKGGEGAFSFKRKIHFFFFPERLLKAFIFHVVSLYSTTPNNVFELNFSNFSKEKHMLSLSHSFEFMPVFLLYTPWSAKESFLFLWRKEKLVLFFLSRYHRIESWGSKLYEKYKGTKERQIKKKDKINF